MTRPTDHDIIGSRPAVDLGPLFSHMPPAEAEAQLDEEFVHPAPEPPAKAREDTGAFDRAEINRDAAMERIKREVRDPLLALAFARADSTDLPGITAQDARRIADARGLTPLVGSQQRAWSWLSPWLTELARQGLLVKFLIADMTVRRTAENGNDQVIYLHPYDHRARGVA